MTLNPSRFYHFNIHFNLVLNTLEKYGKKMRWPNSSNLSMVDIGTGPGQLILEVEKKLPRDYKEIMCIDKQKEMTEHFESIPKDSRIKHAVFDIENMDVPKDLSKRFDFAFSSCVFHFMKDLSQVFRNCNSLLKPGGECFFIWGKVVPFYEAYKKMSTTKKWSPYTREFKDWKCQFSEENSRDQLIPFLENFGFEIIECEDLNDNFFEYPDVDVVLELFAYLDAVSLRIPKCDLPKYQEDFRRITRQFIKIDEKDPKGVKAKQSFPSIVVAAKKIGTYR